MRMNRFRQITNRGPHFNGDDTFGNKLTSAMTRDAAAKDPLRFGVDDQFGKAISSIEGQSAARGAPWKPGYLDLHALRPGFGFSEAAPCDFGVCKNDGRNDDLLKGAFLARDHFDGHASFFGSFVREHYTARDVADGIDRRITGLLPAVYFYESFFVP